MEVDPGDVDDLGYLKELGKSEKADSKNQEDSSTEPNLGI